MREDSLKKYVTLRKALLAEKEKLETRLAAVNAALDESPKRSGVRRGRKRRKMSAKARAKIAAAQRARWAKQKAGK